MHVIDIASVSRSNSPRPGGPIVSRLLTPDAATGLTVVHAELPPGAALPEHGHGGSSVTLIPLAGAVEVTSAGATRTLVPGCVAHIPAGDHVALANLGERTATFMITLSPSAARHSAA
ncbi:MAG TPA: cupin domain-containing protein [Actinocrinis sp.]|nr:cupin domain-containing protein [Actinocrinis sp.]